jgi:hypothetical protein
MSREYKVPILSILSSDTKTRALSYCNSNSNECKINCKECVFCVKKWTPEREAAFLAWERGENE